MDKMTEIDLAHAAMQAAPEDDGARLRFYEKVADAELVLLLAAEPDLGEGSVTPQVFDLAEGRFILVFDREERLAAFAEAAVPYAALPGRVVVRMLAGQGIGLGLNLGVASSETLLPAAGIDWLASTLAAAPAPAQGLPLQFHAPSQLPAALGQALEIKLGHCAGLAVAALLAGVSYADGRRGHVLAFLGANPAAEPALAQAVAEALTFSGIEAGEIDVTFLAHDSLAAPALAAVARRFDMPLPAKAADPADPVGAEAPAAPSGPGMDPARPPRLR